MNSDGVSASSLYDPDNDLDYMTKDQLIDRVFKLVNDFDMIEDFIFTKYGYCYACKNRCKLLSLSNNSGSIVVCPKCDKALPARDDFQHVCCECGE